MITTYTIEGFVNDNAYCNQTTLVYDLMALNNELRLESDYLSEYDFDEISNKKIYKDKEDEELLFDYPDFEELSPYEQEDILESYKEILEWWLISPRLANLLEEKNEAILRTQNGTYWGRTSSDQAISMDCVIESIFNDLNQINQIG